MAARTRLSYETTTAHVVEHKGRPLPIIVEVDGDNLTFRHRGFRKRYVLPIPDAMKAAIIKTPID